jgi:hypothetical protein
MKANRVELVLAVYPNARGFAFVLFEGPDALVDWGMSDIPAKGKREGCLRRVRLLLEKYQPDLLILREKGHSRHAALFSQILQLATNKGIPALASSRQQVRQAFPMIGRATRYAIVTAVVQRFPVLKSYAPGRRKIWNSEDRRMGLFDAAALALTFFADRSPETATCVTPACAD